MSLPHVEIGQELSDVDGRNPSGWFFLFALVGLMVLTQLIAYFTRTPSTDVLVSRVEQQLKIQVSLGARSGDALESLANQLRPELKDASVAALYAAVQTEAGNKVQPLELKALKAGKVASNLAVFDIYTREKLTASEAQALVDKLPQDRFVQKLIRAQALAKAGNRSERDGLKDTNATIKLAISGGLVILLIPVGLMLLVAYAIARGQKLLQPRGFPIANITLPDADRLVLRSAQIFFAFNAIALVGGIALQGMAGKEFLSLPIYFAIVAAIILLAKVPLGGKWISLRSIGLSRDNLGKNILWGIGGAIANLPILGVVMVASMWLFRSLPAPEHPTTVELTTTTNPWVVLTALVMASMMAPFIEEIMFRGTMFPAFSRVLGSPLWGGVWSSLIFAAIHPTGIPVWPGLATIGGMSCFLVYQTRSLVPSMVMHAVHNFGTLVFVLLTVR